MKPTVQPLFFLPPAVVQAQAAQDDQWRNYRMPIGIYRGYTLAEILADKGSGAGYLRWMLKRPEVQGITREAIMAVLGVKE